MFWCFISRVQRNRYDILNTVKLPFKLWIVSVCHKIKRLKSKLVGLKLCILAPNLKMSKQKNVKNLIMSVLPDNRPITSLQIVEDYDKYASIFSSIHSKFLMLDLLYLNSNRKWRLFLLGAPKILCQFIEHMTKILMPIYGGKPTFLDVVRHAIYVYRKAKVYLNIL